jgi:hypothetical protein
MRERQRVCQWSGPEPLIPATNIMSRSMERMTRVLCWRGRMAQSSHLYSRQRVFEHGYGAVRTADSPQTIG